MEVGNSEVSAPVRSKVPPATSTSLPAPAGPARSQIHSRAEIRNGTLATTKARRDQKAASLPPHKPLPDLPVNPAPYSPVTWSSMTVRWRADCRGTVTVSDRPLHRPVPCTRSRNGRTQSGTRDGTSTECRTSTLRDVQMPRHPAGIEGRGMRRGALGRVPGAVPKGGHRRRPVRTMSD